MGDATQKLVDEARESLDQAERFCKTTKREPGQPPTVRVIADMATSLRSAIRALEAAQRPPVSPEARDELIEEVAEALADDWNPSRDPVLSAMFRDYAATAIDAIARFSVPSQPVYDEDAIARWLFGLRYHSMHWLDAKEPERDEHRRDAAALVAALRGGELTREETTL